MPSFPFGFKPDNGSAYDLSDAELAGHQGSFPMRTAAFEYIARDGGDIEGLGAGIEPYSFNCFYTGDNYGERLRSLRAAIQTQPKGLLTHPELGRVRAHCLGIDEYSVNYVTERDTVNFRISFKQDGTDTTGLINQVASVTSKAAQFNQTIQTTAQIIGQVKSVVTDIAAFPTTINVAVLSVTTTLAGLVNFSQIFANSVVQAATLGVVDFTLEAQRQSVFLSCEMVTTALRQTGNPDAALFPSFSALRTLYSQAIELDDLARMQAPQVKVVTVQGLQPIVVFAAQQYGGKAAIGKVPELTANNHVGSFGLRPGRSMLVVGTTIEPSNGA
jgi:prophage DNA circulation protein